MATLKMVAATPVKTLTSTSTSTVVSGKVSDTAKAPDIKESTEPTKVYIGTVPTETPANTGAATMGAQPRPAAAPAVKADHTQTIIIAVAVLAAGVAAYLLFTK